MKNKLKWSSIVITIALLFGYTHCDLMLSPQSNKVNYNKSGLSPSVSNTSSTNANPEEGIVTEDFSNAYSYYEDVVRAKLESQSCFLCHSAAGGAPLTVGSYDDLKAMMMDGTSYLDSSLNKKMIGTIAHGGGVKCTTSSAGVCGDFSNWYTLEFSQNNQPTPTAPIAPSVTNGVSGSIDVVSALGKLNGWAGDSLNPNSSLTVEFYIDGAKGSGVLMGSTVANLPGGRVSGNHGYIFYIPSRYRDGTAHQVFAYAINENGQEVPLSGSPKTVYTYSPSLTGLEYYETSVKPLLNSCMGCHAVNYDQHFNSLLSPTPSGGGSAINNEMINMPAGSHNGKSHPGGNICGNKNNSPCSEIQTWWEIEFN